jgi:hypothetical protein
VIRKDSVRMKIVLPRTAVKLTAAVAAAGLAASACGTVQFGAAAITGTNRISSATLTAQVADLNAAYSADKAKGITPQRATAEETQQVLTWLILFQIYDELGAQQNIYVTPAQAKKQLAALSAQASQDKVTLTEYVSAAGALPPDLVPQLGQYFAILSELEGRIDGGKPPTTQAEQTEVADQVEHAQCVAAKSLSVAVNPQFGVFDYSSYSVVLAPPTLAANPTPSPSASPAVTRPPC